MILAKRWVRWILQFKKWAEEFTNVFIELDLIWDFLSSVEYITDYYFYIIRGKLTQLQGPTY